MLFKIEYNQFGIAYVEANSYGQAEVKFFDSGVGEYKNEAGPNPPRVKLVELISREEIIK